MYFGSLHFLPNHVSWISFHVNKQRDHHHLKFLCNILKVISTAKEKLNTRTHTLCSACLCFSENKETAFSHSEGQFWQPNVRSHCSTFFLANPLLPFLYYVCWPVSNWSGALLIPFLLNVPFCSPFLFHSFSLLSLMFSFSTSLIFPSHFCFHVFLGFSKSYGFKHYLSVNIFQIHTTKLVLLS